MRQRRNAGTTHVARQALWSFWELPRLPRPLVQSKYPAAYPWSAEARSIYLSNSTRPTGGWGLVLEHVTPRNVLLRELIERAEILDTDGLANELFTKLVAAVVTKAEDQALTAAGVSFAQPAGADPADLWARYRAAGLDPSTFASLMPAEVPR